MDKQVVVLALATLILAACSSAPHPRVEIRDTPAPIEDRRVAISSAPVAAPVVAPVAAPVAAPDAAPVTIPGGYLAGDGPGNDIPANINDIPDAIPRSEPLHRFANRPYVALGQTYTPLTTVGNYKERGIASWYGKKFHGKPTSSGDVYDMYSMTAAHPTLPIPSYARVTNTTNKKSVVVRVNDRGPFMHERAIDLSYAAALKLGVVANGNSEVEIESLTPDASMNTLARTDTVENRPLEKQEPVHTATNSNIYLQLGAFKSQEAAENFMVQMRSKLGEVGKQLSVFIKGGLTRIHLGPYASQNEARSSADRLKGALGFKPMLNLH